VPDITLIFQSRVGFFMQWDFHKVEVVRAADGAVVSMTSGDNTPGDSVALGVGVVAFSREVVRCVAVSTVATEGAFRESVLDSLTGLEPWVVRL
jgi:hypothetical protein